MVAQAIEAHVRRLWRHRGTRLPTPRRGPRQQLDLDEILSAGVAIADAEGLAAVSTRAVAARLDKTAMALYPYVGTKENLLALMQDHACARPAWADPGTTLADDLQAWAMALFGVYLSHPWLADRSWSQASQGPNEADWLERLLAIFHAWRVPRAARATAVTMVYATVRACAQTAAGYQRLDEQGRLDWRAQAAATREQIPDLGRRYPLTARLEPLTPSWQENPRAAVVAAVRLLASALSNR
jgi:AcrR family transcriptional regulator